MSTSARLARPGSGAGLTRMGAAAGRTPRRGRGRAGRPATAAGTRARRARTPPRRRADPARRPRTPRRSRAEPRPRRRHPVGHAGRRRGRLAAAACSPGTLWVLMRVISAVQLVVLAFVAALLVTALLQPTVARLRRLGLPRGLATARHRDPRLRRHGAGRLVRGLAGHGEPRQPLRPGPGRHRRAASAGCSTARSTSPRSRSTTSPRTSARRSAPTPRRSPPPVCRA